MYLFYIKYIYTPILYRRDFVYPYAKSLLYNIGVHMHLNSVPLHYGIFHTIYRSNF